MTWLNYHHLLYFWTVARRGSVAAAAEELHLTQPAVSTQIKTLERALKQTLFVRRGRRLELTDEGRVAARYAEEIFTLGRELQDTLAGRTAGRLLPLRIGVVDALPKLLIHRLLAPAIGPDRESRVVVTEDKLDRLLADLAIHELDAVLADAPAPPSLRVRTFSHPVLESGVTFFATPARAKRLARGFPRSLDGAAALLPTENTALRRSLDAWFAAHRIVPAVAAEIDDSAVLKTFGEEDLGFFAAPTIVEQDVAKRYGVRGFGRTDAVRERVYAVTADRKITHPGVLAITEAARSRAAGAR